MLKFAPLIASNLRRKPLRTIFTLASICMAFLLFGLLESFRYGLSTTIERLQDNQLIIVPKTSGQALPRSYVEQIAAVPGITATSGVTYVPILLQDERGLQAALAVDAAALLTVIADLHLSDEEKETWRTERRAALVGRDLAAKYGWKKGDTIPLRAGLHVQKDGSHSWNVVIAAIFAPVVNSPTNQVFFHYEYLNESVVYPRDVVSYIMVRLANANDATQTARSIDALFGNSSAETRTNSMKAYVQRGINQIGDVGAIVLAVMGVSFFTMLLITANAMAQSVRERSSEFAVMKTLGFTNTQIGSLVVAEALLITALGGFAGVLLALLIARASAASGQGFLPAISGHLLLVGGALIVASAALASGVPLSQTSREGIAEALQNE